jgi:hypothetical protein
VNRADDRAFRVLEAGLLLICALGLMLTLGVIGAGCAHGTTGAYQALANVSSSTDASLKAFEGFDHDYQLALVDADQKAGKNQAQIAADLTAYRSKRVTVNKAFADADAVLGTGHALLPLVEAGVEKQTDLTAWLSQLFTAAQEVQQALAAVGVNLGGGK